MRSIFHIPLFLLSFVCAICFGEEFRLGGTVFQKQRTLRQANFELCLQLQKAPASLAFAVEDNRGFLLETNRRELVLTRIDQNKTSLLRASWKPSANTSLVVRHRDGLVEVLQNGRRVLSGLVEGVTRGNVGTKGALTLQSYQRLEAFQFGDDFMRTEAEAKSWGLWSPVSGTWSIHSVMDRIRANPAARIRPGKDPVPDRSPNPFCLAGSAAEGEALILTGEEFWCGYEAAVSLRPGLAASAGLAVSVIDAKNLWLLRCSYPSLGTAASELQLVRRTEGKDEIVARTPLAVRANNWQRLAIQLHGNQIIALVDKVPALSFQTDSCARGKVALWCQGAHETEFDDLEVHSLREATLVSLAPTAQKLAGKWKMTNDSLQVNGAGTILLGLSSWEKCPIELKTDAAERVSLLFAYRDEKNHARATFANGRATITEVRNGQPEEIVLPCPETRGNATLAVYYAEDGAAELRCNGVLFCRKNLSSATGRVGLLTTGAAQFHDVRTFGSFQHDWEQAVDIERFANDPFMQGWASTRYNWIRQTPRETSPAIWLFTGDIYGAFQFDFPLIPGLAARFATEKGKVSFLELKVELEEQNGNGQLLLRDHAGKTLATAPLKNRTRTILPGTQIIDEKIGQRPRTPDTPFWGRVSLHRDGNLLWTELDGTPAFLTTLPNDFQHQGRAMLLQLPCEVDFIHFALRRASLLDYLFERAETDWTSTARWEVTNRFACDPRWSHMNGETRGVASLVSKFQLQGDYTIECFAGMRMRQGDFLEGGNLSYPRVGDINVALDMDGHELFSGYNLLVAAWDPQWSEQWTRFLKQGNTLAKTDQELIPRGRHFEAGPRTVKQEWDPGGRPVHGAWYALKIRKTGTRWEAWFDNQKIFDLSDATPLQAGRQIALWTQNNSIVIARMKVGYSRLARALPPIPAATLPGRPIPAEQAAPAPAGASWRTSPENGFDGLTPWNGDQSAELHERLVGKRHVLLLRNSNSGGDFGVRLLGMENKRLDHIRTITLERDIPEGTKINLYFQVKELPGVTFFLHLTGPDETQPAIEKVGDIAPNQTTFELAEALRAYDPWISSWTCTRMMFGMLHEGYLNAGLGGNGEGAVWTLYQFAADAFPEHPKCQPPVPTPADGQPWDLSQIVLQFEQNAPSWPNLSSCSFTINGRPFPWDRDTVQFHAPTRTLTIIPYISALSQKELSQPVKLAFRWKDTFSDIGIKRGPRESAESEEVEKDKSPSPEYNLEWQVMPDPTQDRLAPRAPLVDPGLASLSSMRPLSQVVFPNNPADNDAFHIQRDDRYTTATITARTAGSSLMLSTNPGGFSVLQYPFLRFQYRIQPGTYIDLGIQTIGKLFTIGLTDCELGKNNYLGPIPGILADGQWHTAVVSLLQRIMYTPLHWLQQNGFCTDICFGNFGYHGTAPGCSYSIRDVRLIPFVSAFNRPLHLFWASPDASGIRGYAVVLDEKPDTIPAPTITQTSHEMDLPELPKGRFYLHVRACDNNGNWSPTTHAPFQPAPPPPSIIATTPANESAAAPDSITVTFSQEHQIPVFQFATIQIQNWKQALHQRFCSYDQGSRTLTITPPADFYNTCHPVDGAPVIATLSGVRDGSGNLIPDFQWSWKLDFAKDKTPPQPPLLHSEAFRPFDDCSKTKNWRSRNIASRIVMDEIIHSQVLEIAHSAQSTSRYEVFTWQSFRGEGPFRVRFRYRLKPNSAIDFLIRSNGTLKGYSFAGKLQGEHNGAIEGIVADDAWHWCTIDLAPFFKTFFPNGEIPRNASIGFGSLEGQAPDATLWIDDFSVISSVGPACLITANQVDATGIAKYEYSFTQEPDSEPTATFARPPFWHVFEKAGLWFLHIRVVDGAGNRSETLHIPVQCSVAASQGTGWESTIPRKKWSITDFSGNSSFGGLLLLDAPQGGKIFCYNYWQRRNHSGLIQTPLVTFLVPFDQNNLPKRIEFDLYTVFDNLPHVCAVAIPPGKYRRLFKDVNPQRGVSRGPASKGKWTHVVLPIQWDQQTPPGYLGVQFKFLEHENLFLQNLEAK
ncbi:MAG: hypothetical protein IJJ26_08020 [Victivallales bacterium]|nr:hypothetical protein [Victivallales bacterium]